MKKIIMLSAVFVSVFIFSFISLKKSLVGHWTITYKSGNKTTINFMANGTFLSEIPSEHFVVGGNYKFTNDVINISDTSCNQNYWGRYKMKFHGDDSVYSEVIEDSCSGRRSAADKVFLVRDK